MKARGFLLLVVFPIFLLTASWEPEISREAFGLRGQVVTLCEVEYNADTSAKGEIVRGKFTDSIVYRFYPAGLLARTDFYSSSPSPATIHHYDTTGNVVRYWHSYWADSVVYEWKRDTLSMVYVFPHHSALDPSRTLYCYRGNQVYLYDVHPEKGDTMGYYLLTKDSLGRATTRKGFYHRDDGNVTARRIQTPEKTILLEYAYEYDSYGNWTKRTMVGTLFDRESKITEKKAWEWTERRIVYAG